MKVNWNWWVRFVTTESLEVKEILELTILKFLDKILIMECPVGPVSIKATL